MLRLDAELHGDLGDLWSSSSLFLKHRGARLGKDALKSSSAVPQAHRRRSTPFSCRKWRPLPRLRLALALKKKLVLGENIK